MFAQISVLTALVGSALVAVLGLAQTALPPNGEQGPVLRSGAELVVLHVAVRDRQSRFVPGLEPDQFRVYEDGVPQTIQFFAHDDRPATIGLVVDNSGSMRSRRHDVRTAALAFIRASNPHNELFIANFNENVWAGLPPYLPFSSDPAILEIVLARTIARGQTALYDAVSAALEHLKGGTNGRQALVVISDGEDNASRTRLDEVLQRAQEAHAVIFTLGLFDERSDDRNPAVLKQLADVTGGERFLPRNSRDASAILERIAHDIRNTYDIGYESTNSRHDGKFRRIEVRVETRHRERVTVRARTGYVVPRDPELSDGPTSPRPTPNATLDSTWPPAAEAR